MTLEELQAIRERLNSITPWPWERRNGTDVFTVLGATNSAGVTADSLDAWQIARCDTGRTTTTEDGDKRELLLAEVIVNAEFIAHAPTDIERLLNEVERLRSVIQWFMEQAGWADEDEPREYGLLIPSHEGREVYERFREALEGGENA